MRRIYESEALRGDDDDPHMPTARNDRDARSIRWDNASHALVPASLRSRAVSVSVRTTKETYARDEPVGFEVEFVNRVPLPISIPTTSPVRWTWELNGMERASTVPEEPPEEPALFEFSRGERKRFTRRWSQRIRVAEREWEPADSGEYTLAVGVNASSGAQRLRDTARFRID